jgi:hypothetical protein
LGPRHPFLLLAMADDAQETRKRPRVSDEAPAEIVAETTPDVEDDDDDDIGPMPVPEGASVPGAAKKKRKGGFVCWLLQFSAYARI